MSEPSSPRGDIESKLPLAEQIAPVDLPSVTPPTSDFNEWQVPFLTVNPPPAELFAILRLVTGGIAGARMGKILNGYGILLVAGRLKPHQVVSMIEYFEGHSREALLPYAEKQIAKLIDTTPGTVDRERYRRAIVGYVEKLVAFPSEIIHDIRELENYMDEGTPPTQKVTGEAAQADDELVEKYAQIETERERDRVALLGRVGLNASELEQARQRLDASVAAARAVGATWSQIAQAVGITQQAANNRWNPEIKKRRADYQRSRDQR